ncbi:MAG: hypothetical protein J7576_09440 [Siphonobacter aquaeclarae]|jgi:hypothetical protein|nr:hypothetical protein [Siphonobacter aquaeclarae]
MKFIPCLLSVLAGLALGTIVRLISPPWADLASVARMILIGFVLGVPSGIMLELVARQFPPVNPSLDIRLFACLGILLSLLW